MIEIVCTRTYRKHDHSTACNGNNLLQFSFCVTRTVLGRNEDLSFGRQRYSGESLRNKDERSKENNRRERKRNRKDSYTTSVISPRLARLIKTFLITYHTCSVRLPPL